MSLSVFQSTIPTYSQQQHSSNKSKILYTNQTEGFRPVLLLPICSRIFEKLIFDSSYDFNDKNNLFNNNQSGLRPNDSCIHQLIAITHNIFSAFDADPSLEVHRVFLDLSKAFDKVWHDDLLYKLKSNGLDGNLFKLIKQFLNKKCPRVVLNGQSSAWKSVSQLVCHKVRSMFQAYYFFSFTLMAFLQVLLLMLN